MGSQEETLNWTQLHSEVQEIQDITKKQKERIASGWYSLEKALGPSWLDNAITNNHPWVSNFRNKAPWIKSYYGMIGERIGDLCGTPGFNIIINKMKTTQDPVGVVGEINAGWKLYKNKIDFHYVETSQENPTVDIVANIDRKEVAVEATAVRIPEFQIKQISNLDRIWKALLGPRICTGGRVTHPLGDSQTARAIEEIENAVSIALKANCKVELPIHEVGEFCIAPANLCDEVDLWKKEHDMSSETILFSPDFYERAGKKVGRIIREKNEEQIGESRPGIIYIEGFSFHVTSYGISGSHYFKTGEVEEAVYEHKNLLFVVLNNLNISESRDILPIARKTTWHPHFYIARKNIAPFLSEQTWLITNRLHRWPKLRHKKLVEAFWYRGKRDPMKIWKERAMKDIAEQFATQKAKKHGSSKP